MRIFRAAFASEHGSRFRHDGGASQFVLIWSFIAKVEPHGFLAAREDGRIVGYAIFIQSLRGLQWKAVRSGAVFKWIWAALRGGFDLRPRALLQIAYNKVLFIRGGQKYRSKGDAQLLNIAVDPSQQGKGIAKRLVSAGLDAMRAAQCPEVRLEVRPWNASAVRVYEQTGWRTVGRTRDLEGEWLVMVANP